MGLWLTVRWPAVQVGSAVSLRWCFQKSRALPRGIGSESRMARAARLQPRHHPVRVDCLGSQPLTAVVLSHLFIASTGCLVAVAAEQLACYFDFSLPPHPNHNH